MATPEDILQANAAAMEDVVSDLSEALPKEADPTDNTVEWPHGEIIIVSNNRRDTMNTDFVGYATDEDGNRIGKLNKTIFEPELQLNIWTAIPAENWDIQTMGKQLERGMRRYDDNWDDAHTLPNGEGGKLEDYSKFRIMSGGELPLEENQNPPIAGYQISVEMRYHDIIDTSEEFEAEDYVESVTISFNGDSV